MLAALGDDSSIYYWRIPAAREIMRLYRQDPAQLDRLAALQTRKNSAEEVLHPPDDRRFDDAGDAARRLRRRPARRPRRAALRGPACASTRGMGELAPRARAAARRSTAGCARRRSRCSLYLGAGVAAISGAGSARRDHDGARRRYQGRLGAQQRGDARSRCTRRAGPSTSPRLPLARQAQAFQFWLDRLTAT